jgi:ABC-2 type transport system ATP-binding protein
MHTVEVSNLAKRFGETQAVSDVSFAVEPGEIFGLLGPNGAGKTTTIRMMLDIFKPDAGTVSVFGGELDLEKKRRIGYMPEDRGLYKALKLEPTLIYLATLKGLDKKTARIRLEKWLERFDLADHRQKKVQELSGGMPVNTRLVKQILEEQRQAGKSILMSTHQMYQVEALCDRIVLIDEGKTVLYGAVDEIKRSFAGNAVVIEGQGEFTDIPGVLEVRKQNHTWHLALEIGTDPQDVFRTLAAREDVKIERFELEEPSLDDIFVNVVQNGTTKLEGSHV